MFNSLLESLAVELGRAAIPYMVVGGQAVLRYGEPRLTRDIDVVIGREATALGPVIEVVRRCGLHILPESPEAFVCDTMVLPCEDLASHIRIDIIFGVSGFETEAFERTRPIRIGSADVQFVSPEDLIVMKIIAGRPRDLDDVRAIALKNPALDLDHVRATLTQFEQALAQRLLPRLDEAIT
ncbi:MAG: hypothetical protein FJY92_09555 [Candidatus Hydrogenedentes bacterium]|nr:hypothetical protein [Candidatus Hydrogenedentota bacterium]